MAPVVQALRAADGFRCWLGLTGKHREMPQRALRDYGLKCDFDFAASSMAFFPG